MKEALPIGRLVLQKMRGGWTLGVVVGHPGGGRVRICRWSQVGNTHLVPSERRWRQPIKVPIDKLEACPEWPEPDPSGRRRRAVVEATETVRAHNGEVRYKGGAHVVHAVSTT